MAISTNEDVASSKYFKYSFDDLSSWLDDSFTAPNSLGKAVIKSDEADSMLCGFRQMLRGLADGVLAVRKRKWPPWEGIIAT